MRCGNWNSPFERSVGHAAAGAEVVKGVTDGEVPVAVGIVASPVETGVAEELESGRPSAVQLYPPVLKVTVSQPPVICKASLKIFQLPSSPGPVAGHATKFSQA